MVKIALLLFFSIVCLYSTSQKYDFVKVLPGKGIVYNNDSILLGKTSIKELHRILKIKDTSNPNVFTIRTWDGYDPETLEETSGSEYTREVKYKSISFEFADESNKDNLKLMWISISKNKTLKTYTDNGLMIGMINPKINEYYPIIGKRDYISDNGLTYNLYNYGISFALDKLENNDLELTEISTHYKNK